MLMLLALAVPAAAANGLESAFYGKVVGVSDGDTLDVMRSGRAVRVRLAGIDCPEKGQPFFRRAKEFTAQAAFGRTVKVTPLKVNKEERWGRVVATVILPDGRDLSRELLKAGLAWWYDRFSPGERDLKELEQQARLLKRGLWREAAPLPPWDFRAGERE